MKTIAGKRITELPPAKKTTGNVTFVIVQDEETRRIDLKELKAMLRG